MTLYFHWRFNDCNHTLRTLLVSNRTAWFSELPTKPTGCYKACIRVTARLMRGQAKGLYGILEPGLQMVSWDLRTLPIACVILNTYSNDLPAKYRHLLRDDYKSESSLQAWNNQDFLKTNQGKTGLGSVDRNNKTTLLLTPPIYTTKSYAKDLSPRIVKLQDVS